MPNIVKAEYNGLTISFTEEARFNATVIAEKYGKRVADWLETKDTQDYINALAEILNVPKTALLKAQRGRCRELKK